MGKRNFEWPDAAGFTGYFTQDTEGGVTERVSPAQVLARLVEEGFLRNAVDFLELSRAAGRETSAAIGAWQWDDDEHTAVVTLEGGSKLSVGLEDLLWAKNAEATALVDGELVYISGASGDNPEIRRASNADPTKWDCIAMVTQPIAAAAAGFVARGGKVRSLNTAGKAPGTKVYLGTAGAWTSTQPTKPTMSIPVGIVLREHAVEGVVLFRPTEPRALGLLSDADTTGHVEGDLLVRNAAGVWVPGHVTVSESAPTGAPVAGDLFWFVVEAV